MNWLVKTPTMVKIAAPVALPVLLVNIAGYLVVAGGVMSTLGQAAIKKEEN
jgi:hypothetical protein